MVSSLPKATEMQVDTTLDAIYDAALATFQENKILEGHPAQNTTRYEMAMDVYDAAKRAVSSLVEETYPHIVQTREELDSLPIGTLVNDGDFHMWRIATCWITVGGLKFVEPELPLRVLWMPEKDL